MFKKTNINIIVIQIISKVLKIKENKLLKKTSIKSTQQWDSLAHINIALALEKKFKTKFRIDDLSEATTIGDWIDMVEKDYEKK